MTAGTDNPLNLKFSLIYCHKNQPTIINMTTVVVNAKIKETQWPTYDYISRTVIKVTDWIFICRFENRLVPLQGFMCNDIFVCVIIKSEICTQHLRIHSGRSYTIRLTRLCFATRTNTKLYSTHISIFKV